MAYPQPTLPEPPNSAGTELQTPLGKAWVSSATVVSKSRPFSQRKAAGSFSNAAEEGGAAGPCAFERIWPLEELFSVSGPA